jgi:hypothetical protein
MNKGSKVKTKSGKTGEIRVIEPKNETIEPVVAKVNPMSDVTAMFTQYCLNKPQSGADGVTEAWFSKLDITQVKCYVLDNKGYNPFNFCQAEGQLDFSKLVDHNIAKLFVAIAERNPSLGIVVKPAYGLAISLYSRQSTPTVYKASLFHHKQDGARSIGINVSPVLHSYAKARAIFAKLGIYIHPKTNEMKFKWALFSLGNNDPKNVNLAQEFINYFSKK